MERDLSYLAGKEVPDGIPERTPREAPIRIIGADGINVHQTPGQALVTLEDELFERLQSAVPARVQPDPFANMAFRCSWVNEGDHGSVLVKKGYVSYLFWSAADGWITDSFEIPEETIELSAAPPRLIYLKIPVNDVSVSSDSDGPYELYDGSGSPVPIEGTNYDFSAEVATNWKELETTPPASYYEELDTPPTASASFYRLKLADVPEDGVVRQFTFGEIRLPQPMIAKLTLLDVTPS